MAEDSSEPSTQADGGQEGQPALRAGFDSYRSLADSNLMIMVAMDVVPPFRFKAGGWELSQSSIELGSAMKIRISENGYQTGGTEMTDLPFHSQTEVDSK
jgi:hypothetical protein